tara:strand:- start:2814 stop:3134 length:321 start_codon:yes stop_codon:yes gene_type:complete
MTKKQAVEFKALKLKSERMEFALLSYIDKVHKLYKNRNHYNTKDWERHALELSYQAVDYKGTDKLQMEPVYRTDEVIEILKKVDVGEIKDDIKDSDSVIVGFTPLY